MATNFPNGLASYGIPLPSDVSIYSPFGQPYFVDGNNGSDGQPGTTPQTAFKTMARAFQFVASLGSIGVIGQLEEQITAPLGVSSVTIFGASTVPRYGNEGSFAHPLNDFGAIWRPAATPLATTPLLTLRQQGWRFVNMMFDCPVDAAGVMLRRQEDATYPDASSTSFSGCKFVDGATGIQDVGGNYNVRVEQCIFSALTSRGIFCSSTAVALPLQWQILNNIFENIAGGITAAFSNALIENNYFIDGADLHFANGKVTTTGGVRNFIINNYTYDIAADVDPAHGYTGVASDNWRTYATGTADPVVTSPPS